MHDFHVCLFNPAFRGCQNPINGLFTTWRCSTGRPSRFWFGVHGHLDFWPLGTRFRRKVPSFLEISEHLQRIVRDKPLNQRPAWSVHPFRYNTGVWQTDGGTDNIQQRAVHISRGVDPMCFSGSGPTHFWRWIVYYCVCNASNMTLTKVKYHLLLSLFQCGNQDMYWIVTTYKACFSKHCFVTAEFKIFISPADCGVWRTHPHFYTDLRPWPIHHSLIAQPAAAVITALL